MPEGRRTKPARVSQKQGWHYAQSEACAERSVMTSFFIFNDVYQAVNSTKGTLLLIIGTAPEAQGEESSRNFFCLSNAA